MSDKSIIIEAEKLGAVLVSAKHHLVRIEQAPSFGTGIDHVTLTRDQLVAIIKFIDDNKEEA